MNKYLKNKIKEVKGAKYIVCVPLKKFKNIKQLKTFVKYANKNNIGITMYHETFIPCKGVKIQLYDKETCNVKDNLSQGGNKCQVLKITAYTAVFQRIAAS